ncbi:fucose isomerase [Christensenellaceae bacterium NSJ-44]|uniref:Fucose isomerase n=1 Tax=Luoshenia tenuis TaxID=2763654 RepID=A0A926HND0_9FIRM|nr:fucose isomerase [Luoshenia tenuis]MBC8530058.1 fucose isomerase [Luoshenia tenuis]
MYEQHKIKIGIVPVRRQGAFGSKEAAFAQRDLFWKKLKEITPEAVELVDINDVTEDGIAQELEHIDPVVNKLKAAGVNGVFFPHANFGPEEITARIAAGLNVPVLIWGNRDNMPDPVTGNRERDTQCGIFAVTKVLQRLHVPFSYIVNVDIEDPKFTKGFGEFCGTVSVIKSFRGMKIAQLSTRPRPFMSVMYDEADLLQRWGIQVFPISLPELLSSIDNMVAKNDDEFQAAYKDVTSRFAMRDMDEMAMKKLVALKPAMTKLIKDVGADACASECWIFRSLIGCSSCAMFGEITDMGIPVACETDVMGAITSVMTQAAALGSKTTFFSDLTIRHPENDNAELLWHCGPYSYSLAKDPSSAAIAAGRAQFEIKDGPITVNRLDGVNGKYTLFTGEGKGVEGPKTSGTYVWLEVDDWEKWEEHLMFGPYIHHCTGIHGNYSRIMVEAAKYIPTLNVDAMADYRMSLGF